MSVDIFERKLLKSNAKTDRGPPGYGFKITFDEQYDMGNKRLCNIANPLYDNDCSNVITDYKINMRNTVLCYRDNIGKEQTKQMNLIYNLTSELAILNEECKNNATKFDDFILNNEKLLESVKQND